MALPAAAMALGLPPIGLIGAAGSVIETIAAGKATKGTAGEAADVVEGAAATAGGLIAPPEQTSPPKEIQALRDSFEQALIELDVTLVVLIDDLDRCLPETAVSTLEAIRLLLFLEHTAFVIAADDEMIKYAVRKHFDNLDREDLVTNYFDKLIQIPIRVPKPGIHEIRAYMMMLFVDNSSIGLEIKEQIREKIAAQLRQSWQGKRVDRAFIDSLSLDLPADLISRIDTAELLAPMMISATGIGGNPRLVKRFLNALEIRMNVSRAQGVGVDESVLAKLLLFERSGAPALYQELAAAVSRDASGHASFLGKLEKAAHDDEEIESIWSDPFTIEWLKLPPLLEGKDLRGAMYVGRESAPIVSDADRLSPESAQILRLLIESPDMASALREKVATLPRADIPVIMDRLLAEARQEQSWGTPAILEALLVIAEADSASSERLSGFLGDRAATQVEPSIVPKLEGFAWSIALFEAWRADPATPGPVKNAIEERMNRGNVAK